MTVPVPPLRDTRVRSDPSRARGASEAAAAISGLVLCSLAVVPLLPWLVDMQGYHAVVATLHAVLCAVGAAAAIAFGLRPVLLVASVFPYCWLVVPSVYQISHELAAWGDNTVTADFSATLRAQILLAVGQAGLLTCYAVVAGLRPSRGSREWTLGERDARRLITVAAGLTLLTLVLVPFVVSSAGGIGVLFSSRGDFNQALLNQGLESSNRAGRALIKTVPAGLATSAALLAIWTFRSRPPGDKLRRGAGWVFATDLALLFVTANPFVYSRYQVLAAFGPVVLALVRSRSSRQAVVWLAVTVTAFLLAYPAAEAFRLTDSADRVANPTLASKDFDGFQQAINAVSYVDAEGLAHGNFLSSGLLFFVPRAVWEGKAIPSTFPVASARGYQFQDLSMPFPAEAYLDFGWAGVVVVLGLLGAVFAMLDRAWRDQSWLAVLAAYLALAQVGLWRGPFGSLAPVFGFAIGTLLLGLGLAGAGLSARRRPRHPDLPSQ